jgi:hypothetical protein
LCIYGEAIASRAYEQGHLGCLAASEETTFRGFLALLLSQISALAFPGFFGKNIELYSNE